MHHFQYSGPTLHCESVELAAVAKLYTPAQVISLPTARPGLAALVVARSWVACAL